MSVTGKGELLFLKAPEIPPKITCAAHSGARPILCAIALHGPTRSGPGTDSNSEAAEMCRIEAPQIG